MDFHDNLMDNNFSSMYIVINKDCSSCTSHYNLLTLIFISLLTFNSNQLSQYPSLSFSSLLGMKQKVLLPTIKINAQILE